MAKQHTWIVPEATRQRLADYLSALRSGTARAGARLQASLAATSLASTTVEALLDLLGNTKVPQIFAESDVCGDGSDWNETELGLLGDLSIAVPVTIYDDGNHAAPVPHAVPFPGTLVFTPGALLRNGKGNTPADWGEVTRDGDLWEEGYHRLYERRLLAVFAFIDAEARRQGRPAFVTVPGLGCGQFAGPFHGQLGSRLQRVLHRILAEHGAAFSHVRAVYFDPYREAGNARFAEHGITFLVRPLQHGNLGKSQLCPPAVYEEDGDDFAGCSFFSIVAWDHVSWPGNDFYAGSRSTDDGVKAAATDVMARLTGVEGHYEATVGKYLPPPPFRLWEQVVRERRLRL